MFFERNWFDFKRLVAVLLLMKNKGAELDINGLASTCFVSAPVLAELLLLLSEYSWKIFLGL